MASFIGLAAVTGADITIEDAAPDDLVSIIPAFERLGVRVELGDDWVRVPPNQELVIRHDIGGYTPKIEDGPWPAFPADLTSIAVAVATQAKGDILIHEKMFENRLVFVDKLVSMGARIIPCDPHRVVVIGPARLYGQRLSSPDIRAGMALVIASLCAEGTSDDREHQRDRPRLRADRRAPALARRLDRARLLAPPAYAQAMGGGADRVRVELAAEGAAQVATGLPVLDHLVGQFARCAGLRVTLEVSPGSAEEEVEAAGRALGAALGEPLRAGGACGSRLGDLAVRGGARRRRRRVAERAARRLERRLLRPARRRARDRRGRRASSRSSPRRPGSTSTCGCSKERTPSTCWRRSSRRSARRSARRADPRTEVSSD